MPISQTMAKGFNEQINREFFSAYLYLSMGAYADDQNFAGVANWMKIQAQEEMAHAMIMYNHVVERGGRIVLEAIDKPQAEFESITELFAATYEHEQKVTGWVNDLMDLAIDQRDHAARSMLNWFIDEQVEEEANADQLLHHAKLVEGNGQAMLMFDKELAARTFVMPSPLAGGGA